MDTKQVFLHKLLSFISDYDLIDSFVFSALVSADLQYSDTFETVRRIDQKPNDYQLKQIIFLKQTDLTNPVIESNLSCKMIETLKAV